ncbi:MAG TPA: SMC-Scp complex subunit ScpB [candidate division Zixibacteria bacterium]|nr:SMC-Scp complex subunit ScpB [candidate division Zixibacteria bacterium]
MSDVSKKAIVEALIFASPNPLAQSKLVSIANLGSRDELKKIVNSLNDEYEKHGRSFRIKPVAGGFQFFTERAFAPYLREVFSGKNSPRVSRAMLEVLGIIALKQPVTKPVIDKIRAADSGAPINSLLEQNLITIRGREKGPGRPFSYGTTREFLRFFGLERLDDLPDETELAGLFADAEEDATPEQPLETIPAPDPDEEDDREETEDIQA